jgi:hypothetical protein
MKKLLFVGLLLLAGCTHQRAVLTTIPTALTIQAASQAHSTHGCVAVQIQGLDSAGYQLKATTQDITSLTITVTSAHLPQPITQTFSADEIRHNATGVVFNEIPAGPVTVSAVAHNGSLMIGHASAGAVVTAGQTATVCLTVVLTDDTGGLGVNVGWQNAVPTATKTAVPCITKPVCTGD